MTIREARRDLADRVDVESLLRRFYDRALGDELLAEPFAGVRAIGMSTAAPHYPRTISPAG